jgi:hypothetical protein
VLACHKNALLCAKHGVKRRAQTCVPIYSGMPSAGQQPSQLQPLCHQGMLCWQRAHVCSRTCVTTPSGPVKYT